MPKIPTGYLRYDATKNFDSSMVESAMEISEQQLLNAKILPNRESFIKHLQDGLRYLEIGVAWGYYTDLVCQKNPSILDLMDTYDQDLKCWSWRKFGECKCDNYKHELLYLPETHEQYIKEKYSKHNVRTIKARAPEQIPSGQQYDFIYIDFINDRIEIRDSLIKCRDLVPVGGIVGLNDYIIYDGVIEDSLYGTFQAVHEFLSYNRNWEVAFLALHPLGFYDIYLRKTSDVINK